MGDELSFKEAVDPMARKYRWVALLNCEGTINAEMARNTEKILVVMATALDNANHTIRVLQNSDRGHGLMISVAWLAFVAGVGLGLSAK